MGIKLFSSKKVWICIGILGGIASLVSILEFLIKIKILKLLLSLLAMIINLKIPDIIFIIIVLIFLSWPILNRKKIREILNADIGNLRKGFDNLKREVGNRKDEILRSEEDIRNEQAKIIQSFRSIIGKVERYETIEPTEGLIFILEKIGSILKKNISRNMMFVLYKIRFKNLNDDDAALDFNVNINSAEIHKFIEPFKTKAGVNYFRITRFGFEYLKEQKRRKRNKKK